jgi:membrane-associated protease RseP (regulator of RpoE activity)
MENSYLSDSSGTNQEAHWAPVIVLAEAAPGPEDPELRLPPPRRRRVWLPLVLFLATCLSTLTAGGFVVGYAFAQRYGLAVGLLAGFIEGLKYAVPVMTILICHEMGHFIQAWRYRVYASWPYFIPMPFSPLGTFGAVIAMEARTGDRRALFDIGITGPLAGLVPTMIFLLLGLHWSHIEPVAASANRYGNPLLLEWLARWMIGPMPPGSDIVLNPVLFAGWVGLLVTSLNLLPIGQLDGGHILYGILRRKAHGVAAAVLVAVVALVGILNLWWWWPMLILLALVVGTRHPPTANDYVPLGWFRLVLGLLTLAFLPLGFTPWPFMP